MKVTLSILKADCGGFPGHVSCHPELKRLAERELAKAKRKKLLFDFRVASCGDDLELFMTHKLGVDNAKIHGLAWNIFKQASELGKKLKLYAAGQDLLKEAFTGTMHGMGPGYAETEFQERPSEPIIVFMGDKCDAGAYNLPFYRAFGDAFNTAGLVIDPAMHAGFVFEVWDLRENKRITLRCPEEAYDLLALIGAPSRFVVKRIFPKPGHKIPANEPVAVLSVEKLSFIAGRYVGKDDPVAIARCQAGLPAVGEVLEGFTIPHLSEGWMRGSHVGPLIPVSLKDARATRFDGPPRVVALGFQINNGLLEGPVDLFDDVAFDITREKAMQVADYLRRHGPFEPHRLGLSELEYSTLPAILEKLKDRFVSLK